MNESNIPYFPKAFSSKAISAYIVVLVLCLGIFFNKRLPVLWIAFGLAEVITFFYFSNRLTQRWAKLPYIVFKRKLINTALVLRVVYVIFIYFFYTWMNGTPFEFDAADSVGYHNEAIMIIDWAKAGGFMHYFTGEMSGISDKGFPLWLSAVYTISFNSIMVARLINAIAGAWMCWLIYKIAQRNFGEQSARISAIFAMLLPTFIYYCGMHTKETIMVFFLVAFAERADYLLRMRTVKIGVVASVVILGLLLFFFRTVLAAAAWFSLFSALLFSAKRMIGSGRRALYITWFVIAALFVFSGRILSEVQGYMDTRAGNLDSQMDNFAMREAGNIYAKYGSTLIFAPLMLFAPFPTLVNIEGQENSMMINGNMYIHNVYAFFILLSLLIMYRSKMLNKHILILTLVFSYLGILASSGFALSERFHMPAIPFLLILAGYGVTQVNTINRKYYIPYLVLMAIIIISWNWFKLAGRGII